MNSPVVMIAIQDHRLGKKDRDVPPHLLPNSTKEAT
jgi:hypothetical protein